MQKKEARSYHKKIREAMTDEQVRDSSKMIAEHILRSHQFRKAEYILAYYPLGKEVSLLPVIEYCFHADKKIAFPRVSKGEPRYADTADGARVLENMDIPKMEFYEITNLASLSEGTFHVMEPDEDCHPVNWQTQWSESKTLVLTPGVAFDRTGARVGCGKGYYDHFFADYPECIRMGVAYENQVENVIETDKQDINMQYLVTEENILELLQKTEN